ncbi:uncharacterized protein G2W53_033542 [Senna tora]|uniref:Uncharacterized protein n=1 Tax=Senna tora TaxID=362788 RepID=A0A834T1G4_9FABA|nr:uncharacterized protein G2W53_033542 [Senna tora]
MLLNLQTIQKYKFKRVVGHVSQTNLFALYWEFEVNVKLEWDSR